MKPLPSAPRTTPSGFSVTELVTVISIMGVLAAIAIESFSGVTEGSKEALAMQKLETVNRAVESYAMARGEIILTPQPAKDFDEQQVLKALQADHPRVPGDPFLVTHYLPATSSSVDDFRMQWKGMHFVLLKPGEPGIGLQVPFDGSDFGEPRVVDPYEPVGGR